MGLQDRKSHGKPQYPGSIESMRRYHLRFIEQSVHVSHVLIVREINSFFEILGIGHLIFGQLS